jgi:hypothetical protein
VIRTEHAQTGAVAAIPYSMLWEVRKLYLGKSYFLALVQCFTDLVSVILAFKEFMVIREGDVMIAP